MASNGEIQLGDIVSVQSGPHEKKTALVIGGHTDYAGRQILHLQLEPDTSTIFHAWYPTVTRVKRTVAYSRPSLGRHRTVERRIYW